MGGTAHAFPSNTRYGYANCQSCHVSPAGGGVLNSYGRSTAADFLSTDTSPNEEEVVHGALDGTTLPLEDRVNIGGDVRYLSTRFQDTKGDPIQNQNFWMQRDVEASLRITKELSIDGSYGAYALGNNKYQGQTRRNYVLLNLNDNFSVRAGKFFPAYGIMLEDHTVATRQGLGFDQGQETYNAEFSYKSAIGEAFVTALIGGDNTADLTQSQGYVLQSDQKGGALRLAGYLGESSQVGVSGLYTQILAPGGGWRSMGGAYAMTGITRSVYLLTETDEVKTNLQPNPQIFSFTQLGWEVTKGFHVQGQYQRRAAQNEYDLKLQWFPRPHYELAAELGQVPGAGETLFFLLHYYL